jgi:uncharacterized protein (DUF1697 family)
MQFVSILRGINVGGKRKILMADLKVLYAELGFTNIISYIQSGNVIFDSDISLSEKKLELLIKAIIENKYGFDVPVIVLSKVNFEIAVSNNPYTKGKEFDIERLHATFISEKPIPELIEKANSNYFEADTFKLIDKTVYLYCSGKYHESKLGNTWFEKQLKVSATTRNWKTVTKLLELLYN